MWLTATALIITNNKPGFSGSAVTTDFIFEKSLSSTALTDLSFSLSWTSAIWANGKTSGEVWPSSEACTISASCSYPLSIAMVTLETSVVIKRMVVTISIWSLIRSMSSTRCLKWFSTSLNLASRSLVATTSASMAIECSFSTFVASKICLLLCSIDSEWTLSFARSSLTSVLNRFMSWAFFLIFLSVWICW